MPTQAQFHRQLEALLMIPPVQAHAPGGAGAAPPPVAAPPAPPIEVPACEATAPTGAEVPSYLQSPGPAWATAETVRADGLPIPREVLPFVEGGGPPAIAAASGPPPERVPSGTLAASSLPLPPGALPFGPQPPQRPAHQAEPSVAETRVLAELPIPRNPLPFVEVSADASDAPRDTVPFSVAAIDPVIEGLTLAAYAALCADLALYPLTPDAVFSQHGLVDPARRRAVDLAWQAQLKADPAAYARWQEMYRRRAFR